MDNLKKRLETLREELQQVEQPDKLAIWTGIASSLPVKPEKGFRLTRNWLLAAILLLSIGIGLGYWWRKNLSEASPNRGFAELPPVYENQLNQYQELVRQKEASLYVNSPNRASLAREFGELQLLDSLQQAFLSDFEALPKDYRTAQRYLHYYEQKIRILELIIKEIQIKNNEKEKNLQWQI